MSQYLLLSDLHLADRPPSRCTPSYTDDLFDLLDQTVHLARQRNVSAVVWAGDIYHIKTPSRTSHELVIRTIDLIKSYPCPVFIVPGNHDIRHDRLESIDAQPLGALYRGGARRLQGWADSPDGSLAEPLYGVPWLQGYGENTPESDLALGCALRDYTDPTGGEWEKPCLVVAHAPLYPPGQELPQEYFPAERWAEVMGSQGHVFYGHVHPFHGVYQAGGVTFCNNGALSRGSLHESELVREIGCTLWDDQIGEFEFVPLNAKPAEQVFRLAEKRQVTDWQGRLDEFLAGVGAATLELVSVEAVIEHIRGQGLSPDEVELATELLQEASHG